MELGSVDIALLTTLNVLLTERSVSGTAARLGLSQPTVSAQLKRLRALFEDPLLLPAGRGMAPTERGQALHEPLRRVLGDLGSLLREQRSFDPLTSTRRFTIGMTEYARAVCTGPLVAAIQTRAPNVTIKIDAVDARRAHAMLESGTIELLLGGELAITQSLKAARLFDDPLLFAQRAGHPRGHAPVDLEALAASRAASIEMTNSRAGSLIDDALAEQGVLRTVVTRLHGFLPLIEVLTRSDLVAILPKRLTQLFADRIDVFALPLQLPAYVHKAAWHDREQADDGHRWLRQLAAETLR